MMCTESIIHLDPPGSTDEEQYFPYDATVYADARGQGYIGIDWFRDPERSNAFNHSALIATPNEGYEFLGWYDIFGNLISTDNKLIIQSAYSEYPNLIDIMGKTTVYVKAKFSY